VKRLSVTSKDDVDNLAQIVWRDGHAVIESVDPSLRATFQQIIDDGLSEWLNPHTEPTLRTTPSTDPSFLDHLGKYLQQQTSFKIVMSDSLPETVYEVILEPLSGERVVTKCQTSAAASKHFHETCKVAEYGATVKLVVDGETRVSCEVTW
jgi:hypothetical protein